MCFPTFNLRFIIWPFEISLSLSAFLSKLEYHGTTMGAYHSHCCYRCLIARMGTEQLGKTTALGTLYRALDCESRYLGRLDSMDISFICVSPEASSWAFREPLVHGSGKENYGRTLRCSNARMVRGRISCVEFEMIENPLIRKLRLGLLRFPTMAYSAIAGSSIKRE